MGRSGQNINILNYRLGEIFIAIAFFVSIYCLFSREIDIIFKLFLLINLINLIFRFSYPTAFRLSSFVWSVSIFFFLNYKLKFNEKLVSYVFYLLFFQNIVYIFSMISEEFIFGKYFNATEQVVISFFFLFIIINYKTKTLIKIVSLFLLSIAILFIINFSRASFLAICFGLLFLIILNKEKKSITLIIFFVFSIITMFNVFQKSGYLNDIYQYKLLADFTSKTIFNNLNTDSIKNLEEQYGYSMLTNQNNTENFYNNQYSSHLSKQSNFLSCNNDIFTFNISFSDPNLSWRIQISEDIINCVTKSAKVFIFGYGYEEIMTPLDNIFRIGTDLTNPNTSAHNILLQSLYHGGVLNMFLFMLILYRISNLKGTKIPSPTLVVFFISGFFGVVFETVNQLVFWSFVYLENKIYINNKLK